jgi:hypothetical protein
MNCLRCNTPNEEGAKFCKNCGMDLTYTPFQENKNSKFSDTFLIIFICIGFVSSIANYAIEILVENSYVNPTKFYRSALLILQNISFILIPLAIKNKSIKIIGLILILIMVVYWTYLSIKFMTS